LWRDAIGTLEGEGWMQRLEVRLERDSRFRQAMAEAHRTASAFRQALIPEEWLRRLDDPRYRGQRRVVQETGVAGIRWQRGGGMGGGAMGGVKCLHAHFADYIGRGCNPVGEWVARRLS